MNPWLIEWAWLVVAGLGWILKLFLLASARVNYRRYRHGTALQIFMAKSFYYHMAHMMATITVCAAAAIYAVTHPPPRAPHESFTLAIMFSIVTVMLSAHALRALRWWNRLEDGYYNGHKDVDAGHVVTTVETKISSTGAPAVQVTQTDHPGTGEQP